MKKAITISLVVILAIGFGVYLYKISPSTVTEQGPVVEFNTQNVSDQLKPSEIFNDDHILGNPQAKNTAIIYEDLECPACANYSKIATQIPQALQDTKLVFRHFPLVQIHKNASIAALASEAAAAQGKFWEFVKLAYEKRNDWAEVSDPTEKLAEIAKNAGVANIEKFKADVKNQTFKERVQKDLREAIALKIQGTPTLYFNGTQLQLGDLESLKKQAESLYVK